MHLKNKILNRRLKHSLNCTEHLKRDSIVGQAEDHQAIKANALFRLRWMMKLLLSMCHFKPDFHSF